jgi:threonine dehydrogenase-like Zn-dependent dehydrogenase
MKHLFKSLSEFQQVVPVIHKGTQGYGYSYADLPAIFEVINPLLKEHGLGFTQPIMGDTIKTVIFHIESGESIESLTEIPKNVTLKGMNDFQVLGSAITYLRRYALSSILGLVTDKDTDAGGQQQPKQVATPKKKDTLTKERFEKALETIKAGKYTVDKLKAEYQLTDLQTKALLLL